MTDHPTSAVEDVVAELRARVIEAESLVKVLRQRSVADQTTIQRAAAEIATLRDQMTQMQDAYEQLTRLVETNPGPAATND